MTDPLDTDVLFDDDYRHFYEALVPAARSEAETELLVDLGQLDAGCRVLDVGCGYGRIANRLVTRGCRVVGVDSSAALLAAAQVDGRARGGGARFVRGDMRRLPFAASFDACLSWFTSLGFFADDEIRAVLRGMRAALRDGGRAVIEGLNVHQLVRDFQEHGVVERGADLMIDRNSFDAVTGRSHHRRTLIRDGLRRDAEFSVRHFAFPELRDWLLAAGFAHVEALGADGESFDVDSARMIAVAWA